MEPDMPFEKAVLRTPGRVPQQIGWFHGAFLQNLWLRTLGSLNGSNQQGQKNFLRKKP